MGFIVLGITVVDNLGGWFASPGHDSHGADIRLENHIFVTRVDVIPVGVGKFAGDALNEDTLGQSGIPHIQKLLRRNKFTAGVTGNIGNKALHLRYLVLFQPILN